MAALTEEQSRLEDPASAWVREQAPCASSAGCATAASVYSTRSPIARAGLDAKMLGTAAQAIDMTLEYLKTRVQFGRVIGSFQALGNVAELSSLSKSKMGDFQHEMSNQLIQIHAGIGMTDEFDAGFYLKRACTLGALRKRSFHRDRYARLLGF